jgi:hypothetical protein
MGRGSKMPSTTAVLQAHPKTAIKPRRRGRPRDDDRPVPPTPETKLKLRPNFFQILEEDPRTQHLAVAAAAIAGAFNLIWRRNLMRAGSMHARVDGEREADDYPPKSRPGVLRYHAWRDEMDRRRIDLEWMIAMIVDGMAPAEVEWRAHWPAGVAAERLIEALGIYCKLER